MNKIINFFKDEMFNKTVEAKEMTKQRKILAYSLTACGLGALALIGFNLSSFTVLSLVLTMIGLWSVSTLMTTNLFFRTIRRNQEVAI